MQQVAAVLAYLAAGGGGLAGDAQAPEETCALESGATHSIARVADSETFVLDDGSEVRLIGALAPRLANGDGFDRLREGEARTALEQLVLGRDVELRFGGRRSDRYGRHLAHVFVATSGGEKLWVQGFMLTRGLARAYALAGNSACMTELLAHEREARVNGRGLWGVAAYRVLEATQVSELLARRGAFVVVEGMVRGVALRGGRAYVNFGADWRQDFTAVAPAQVLRSAPEAAERLAALKGKRIRVRGWVERRNGPSVEIASLADIEDANAGAAENTKRPVGEDPGAPQ